MVIRTGDPWSDIPPMILPGQELIRIGETPRARAILPVGVPAASIPGAVPTLAGAGPVTTTLGLIAGAQAIRTALSSGPVTTPGSPVLEDAPWWLELLPIFPWQTPTGEGFIAPWTGEQRLPSGLFGQTGVDYPQEIETRMYSTPKGPASPTRVWNNAFVDANGQKHLPSVVFAKMSNGYMMSQSVATGEYSFWRPKKHIVISTNPRISHIKKLERVHKKVSKMLAKYAPKKKGGGLAPMSRFLSPAEKKMIAKL